MTESTSNPPTHRCEHGPLGEHHPGHDAICLDHVGYIYPGMPTAALEDVTLHVEYGCNLGIIGPNGAGKSTLIKLMLGLLQPDTGDVRIANMTPRAACRRGDVIGYVPQRPDVEWRIPVTVAQVVRMGLVGKTGMLRRYRKADRDYVETIMRRVGIAGLRNRPIGQLSTGQQQRVFIARALAAQPAILILDEPTVGVDEAGQQQFAALIHELHEQLNLTMVVVSHDIQAIAAGCNRVACLKQRIHFHDAPAGLTPDVLAEVFEHEIRVQGSGGSAPGPRSGPAIEKTRTTHQ